jgi:hypothetical protein
MSMEQLRNLAIEENIEFEQIDVTEQNSNVKYTSPE